MPAYYNEIDPYAAQWLRNLIDGGHIARGDVDERSIVDVRADDLRGYSQCHFFAGIGGWSYALRLAGWPDDRPVWTGSCPCQPFSLAGKQAGYADERHLWPTWARLIKERQPPTVFGEQVASATKWLRLVRSDLESLGYAVGAIPIEAASAGADHLRDRYWFVGHDTRKRWGEGRPEHEVRSGRPAIASASGVGLADADDAGSQGRRLLSERAGERIIGPDGLADATSQRGHGRENPTQPSGRHVIESDGGDLADAMRERTGRRPREDFSAQSTSEGARDKHRNQHNPVGKSEDVQWVIGADGKARRVKPGVRLLAHGIPARVAKLRAFGNAIDPRPAAEFIAAYSDGK